MCGFDFVFVFWNTSVLFITTRTPRSLLRPKANLAIDHPPPNFGPVGSERRPGPIRHGEVNDEDSERNSVVSEGRSVTGMMIISPGRA